MSETSAPNLGQVLQRIHLIVTRGLDVSIDGAARFAQEGFPDEGLSGGYRDYVAALLSFLYSHHLAEDDIAFPYFAERLPDVPFDQLELEHQQMEGLLQRAQGQLEGLSAEPEQTLHGLEVVLAELRELWHPHITIEEEGFGVERLAEMLPAAEHVRLAGEMAKHSLANSGPDYLVIPFLLYNLPPDERAIQIRMMPPQVVQELVPVVWKEKWAPMQPFLLD